MTFIANTKSTSNRYYLFSEYDETSFPGINDDANELKALRSLYRATGAKVRFESDLITLYFDTADEIFAALRSYPCLRHMVRDIWYPENETAVEHLRENSIIMHKPKYNYRVNVREGRYSEQERSAVLRHLDSLGDQVMIPQGLRHRLSHEVAIGLSRWVAGYFYVQSEQDLLFLYLISPGLILNKSKVVAAT